MINNRGSIENIETGKKERFEVLRTREMSRRSEPNPPLSTADVSVCLLCFRFIFVLIGIPILIY